VDLNRYAGRWFEIARYPNRFQKQCASDVTAEYVLKPDGRITVVNRCKRADGTWDEAQGVARRAGSDSSNAKLEVRFAPAFLSFLPVWGDYWVMDLAPDYSHALVGSPDRKYIWVLARSASDPDLLARLEPKIRELGFDPAKVQATRHTAGGSTE
jgi:apolipoprotein D and lipocalin family protein